MEASAPVRDEIAAQYLKHAKARTPFHKAGRDLTAPDLVKELLSAIALFADPFGVRDVVVIHAPRGGGNVSGPPATLVNFLTKVLPPLRPLGLDLLVLQRNDRALAGSKIAPIRVERSNEAARVDPVERLTSMELRGKLSPRLSRNRSAQLARGCRRLFSSGPLGFQDEHGAKGGRRRIDGSIRVRARRFRRHAARARNGKDAAAASHAADFDPPIYNVWKQQEKTPGSKHFGNSEVRWVDNLLYLYTQPFDIVVDPFAGGGSTIDLCKKRFRRCWASDRKPIIERETGIRKHDLTEGLPALPRWMDVALVYLDPPYWVQAKGEYGDDPTDLANMELDAFNDALARLFKHIHTRRL